VKFFFFAELFFYIYLFFPFFPLRRPFVLLPYATSTRIRQAHTMLRFNAVLILFSLAGFIFFPG